MIAEVLQSRPSNVGAQSCMLHTPWRRHPQNLSFEVALSGGTTMRKGTGERVANEPTTWRPSHLCAIVVFTDVTAMIQGITRGQ